MKSLRPTVSWDDTWRHPQKPEIDNPLELRIDVRHLKYRDHIQCSVCFFMHPDPDKRTALDFDHDCNADRLDTVKEPPPKPTVAVSIPVRFDAVADFRIAALLKSRGMAEDALKVWWAIKCGASTVRKIRDHAMMSYGNAQRILDFMEHRGILATTRKKHRKFKNRVEIHYTTASVNTSLDWAIMRLRRTQSRSKSLNGPNRYQR